MKPEAVLSAKLSQSTKIISMSSYWGSYKYYKKNNIQHLYSYM